MLVAKIQDQISIRFRKGKNGKQNSVVIESKAQTVVINAWEQGIIPHEMVHYAVEKTFDDLKGFLRLTGEGFASEEIEGRKGGVSAAYVEFLVGAFQYELWGMAAATNDQFSSCFRDFTSKNNEIFTPEELFGYIPAVSEIEACRGLLRELTDQWNALPDGEELVFVLDSKPAYVPRES